MFSLPRAEIQRPISPITGQQGVPEAEHGAASMNYQLGELEALQPDADVTAAPQGFDPVVWEAFVPEDNAMTREMRALEAYIYAQRRGTSLNYGKH